jgi:prepilin-type N-terminal cleavage/methylation domain-containing protein
MKKSIVLDGENSKVNYQSGFSVIELAIVVMISLILVSFSVIYFAKAKRRYTLSQKAQSISWQIERARSLAIKYNQTLSMGFTTSNSILTLTCTDCATAKLELPAFSIPEGVQLSAYPTMTLKGNGTITSTNGTIVISDAQSGGQVTLSISNSGRTTVSELTQIAAN